MGKRRHTPNSTANGLRTLSMRSRTLPSKLQPLEYLKEHHQQRDINGINGTSPLMLTPEESPAASPLPPTSTAQTPNSPPAKPFKQALQQLLAGNLKSKKSRIKNSNSTSLSPFVTAKVTTTPAKNTPLSIRNGLRFLTAKSRSYLSAIPSPPPSSSNPSADDSPETSTPDSTIQKLDAKLSLSCKKSSQKIREDAFYKSLQPRRLLEWSDTKNDFLTLQNYMSSMKVRKHKIKLEHTLLNRHEELEPRMRAILFDWLMEVCDCFHLQRSTFYLAQYYIDAYLSVTGTQRDSTPSTVILSPGSTTLGSICSPQLGAAGPGSCHKEENSSSSSTTTVSKTRLQLLGITSLFVAAKIEEIDPPRLSRFSYITDGACTDDDICLQEIDILQTLGWVMNPVSVYDWLRLYLQTTYFYLVKSRSPTASPKTGSSPKISPGLTQLEVSKPYIEDVAFTPMVFAQMCQLLDLAILDVDALKWQPYELAASILYHFSSQNTAKRASNLNLRKLVDCVSWLTPMALTLKESGLLKDPLQYSEDTEDSRNYRRVPPSQWYNLQFHEADTMDLLDEATKRRNELAAPAGDGKNTQQVKRRKQNNVKNTSTADVSTTSSAGSSSSGRSSESSDENQDPFR